MNRLFKKNSTDEYIVVSKNGVRLSEVGLRAEIIGKGKNLLSRSSISIKLGKYFGSDINPNGQDNANS